jgi:mannose-6-phosphate isomerase-like protein (cupin superfamily)
VLAHCHHDSVTRTGSPIAEIYNTGIAGLSTSGSPMSDIGTFRSLMAEGNFMMNLTVPSPRAAAGDWLETRPGEHCLIRVPAAATGGIYSLVEIISDPGDATPLHMHENEDEHLIVLEGRARIAYGDDIFDAETGKMVTLKKGIPHAWGNRSNARLRIAAIAAPGGVEECLRIIAQGGEIDLPALAERFGVRHCGPAPF